MGLREMECFDPESTSRAVIKRAFMGNTTLILCEDLTTHLGIVDIRCTGSKVPVKRLVAEST